MLTEDRIGATDGIRTHGLLITNQTLYQAELQWHDVRKVGKVISYINRSLMSYSYSSASFSIISLNFSLDSLNAFNTGISFPDR